MSNARSDRRPHAHRPHGDRGRTEAAAPPRTLRSDAGKPLDVGTAAFFGRRFGHDFSSVRVHEGPSAAAAAEHVHAKAFTVGRHVTIGRVAPSQRTAAGLQVLAHELAHIVQQSRTTTAQGDPLPVSCRHSPAERDAHLAAAAAMTPGAPCRAPRLRLMRPAIQRWEYDRDPALVFTHEIRTRDHFAQTEGVWTQNPDGSPRFEARYWVDLRVDENGVMSGDVRLLSRDGTRHSARLGSLEQNLRSALDHFESRGVAVNEFRSEWSPTPGETQTNWQAFRRELLRRSRRQAREVQRRRAQAGQSTDWRSVLRETRELPASEHEAAARATPTARALSGSGRLRADSPVRVSVTRDEAGRPVGASVVFRIARPPQPPVRSLPPPVPIGGGPARLAATAVPVLPPPVPGGEQPVQPQVRAPSSRSSLGRRLRGAVRGGGAQALAMAAHQTLVAGLERHEEERAVAAFGALTAELQACLARGDWVVVFRVLDSPSSIEVLGPAVGYQEPGQLQLFHSLFYESAPTLEEALAAGRARARRLTGTRIREGRVLRAREFARFPPPVEEGSGPRPPFPVVAMATFRSGAVLRDVMYGGRTGFDDEGTSTLEVPAGTRARFYLLRPPSEIDDRYSESLGTVSVPVVRRSAGSGESIRVVDLDPSLRAVGFDVTAAMIFPADEATRSLFEYSRSTRDATGLLMGYENFDLIRWIAPGDVALLPDDQ
jgi:uncharacterized protein DUF4157